MKKKSSTGLLLGLAAAGAGLFLFAGNANAKGKDKPKGGGGDGKGGRGQGGDDADDRADGGAGPGGSGKGKGKGKSKGGKKKPSSKEDRGFVWGDRSKIPDDFDFLGNKIWISQDCSTVAVGYWFLAEGVTGSKDEPSRVSFKDLLKNADDKADKLRYPRTTDVLPFIFDRLGETETMTVYTWLVDWWESRRFQFIGGDEVTEEDSAAADWPLVIEQSVEALIRQASKNTGGTDCSARQDLWSEAMWQFRSFILQRATEFQKFVYQPV